MTWETGTGAFAAQIPGYELLNPTGRGAMGRVYVARQTALSRLVAIKFLAYDPDSDPVERMARFRREAALMASLVHPNIVAVHDFGEDDDRPYLVMEYVEGGDLRRLMPEGQAMPADRAVPILTKVAEALQVLHDRGILHRDLKPENIMMHADSPKVADFGIAVERSGSGELTRSAQGLGTLGYVAPELQYRLPVDERADQYSLAAMTYEMLTGQRPLGLFKPPSRHNPALPPAVDAVVLRGLEEEPGDRFASVAAFSEALRAAFDPPPADRSPPPPRPRRGRYLAPVALVPALALAAWLILGPTRGGRAVAPRPAPEPRPILENGPPPPRWPEPDARAFEELTSRRSFWIWHSEGRPGGDEGAAVKDYNWYLAERQIRKALNDLAVEIWAGKPRRGTDPEAREVWEEAERRLLAVEPRAEEDVPPAEPPQP